MIMLRAGGLLDVLTPLSDCRQESVEKMERRIFSSRLSLWRSAPQEKLLLCVNVAAPEKRSRPAHGWKGRPRSWQRSARWYQAFFFLLLVPGARWYPTLKPRQIFHTKTKISRTSGHTHKRSVFFFLHVAIRNSLRSNNLKNRHSIRKQHTARPKLEHERAEQVQHETREENASAIKRTLMQVQRSVLWLASEGCLSCVAEPALVENIDGLVRGWPCRRGGDSGFPLLSADRRR